MTCIQPSFVHSTSSLNSPRLDGGVMADAIMDRIVHNADTVDLGKINMRELLARK